MSALEALLQDRFNPHNYQVKTVAPKSGNVDVAVKLIGDFSVKLMTLESAISHGATPVGTATYSANAAYGKLRGESSKSSKRSGAADFASRCVEIQFPDTLAGIIDKPPDDLEIDTSTLTPVYANDFEGLKEGVYKYPITWGFANGQKATSYGMSGYCNVLAILRLDRSVMFICKGATRKINMGVCCHTSLLTPEYNRICGSTWGNMHKAMKLKIIGSGPFAIGVGTSYGNIESKSLVHGPIKFRVGMKYFTISK